MKMLRRTPPAPARPSRPMRSTPSFAPTTAGRNFVAGVSQFVYDTRSELRKVVWPTREQTINLTALVIGVSVAVGAFIGVVDAVLRRIVQLVLGG